MNQDPRQLLRQLLDAGLQQVSGQVCVAGALARNPVAGPVQVVAVGKAADGMMRGAMTTLAGQFVRGLVIPRADSRQAPLSPADNLGIVPGSHPVPDRTSLDAGQAMIDFVAAVPPGHTLLVLISGGASSLVEVLAEGADLDQLVALNRYLLSAGLDIRQCNLLRRRLSRIKAGGLLDFVRTEDVVGLLISDVPGDDPTVIGSGLLTPQPLPPLPGFLPDAIRALFPPVRPVSATRTRVRQRVIAGNTQAREAIGRNARERGLVLRQAQGVLDGDAAAMGRQIGRLLETATPGLYLWGGETTVSLPTPSGQGGRNQHLALAAAMILAGRHDVHLLACGSDGNDGPGPWAGALVDGDTLARGRAHGLDPDRCLAHADSGAFLLASGDLVKTGPTGTNVSDLVLALVATREGELR